MEMITHQYSYQNAQIIVAELEKSSSMMINDLRNFDEYQDEYQAFRTEKRQREFLGVRIALNLLLGKNVLVIYDENNKPRLSDDSFQISISHSGNYIAVIVHPDCAVGIDVESRTNKVLKVYTRFLNKDEQTEFYDEHDTGAIEIAWSAKETLYKIIGREVMDFAKQLQLFPFELNESGELKALQVSCSKIFTLKYFQNKAYTLVFGLDNILQNET